MAFLIGGANSAAADDAYSIANSCVFNGADGPKLTQSVGTYSSTSIGTFSFWVKRANLGTASTLFSNTGANDNNRSYIYFNTSDQLHVAYAETGISDLNSTSDMLFRDTNAWYHIVIAVDSTQGTAANRLKAWVNGKLITWGAFGGFPNTALQLFTTTEDRHAIAFIYGASNTFYGYMAEAAYTDGQAYDMEDFGEYNSDSPTIWQPKDISGLTFGTNGWWLDFEDSSALGDDVSGNGNDFTVANLAATDQSSDSPTNNYAVINPLDNYFYAATLSEGNLKQTANASNYSFGTSTFGVSSGKWVVEVKIGGSTLRNALGITDKVSTGTTDQLGDLANAWQYGANGTVYNSGSDIGDTYDTYTADDIIGIYLDLDNNKLYFSKNGTVQNSGTGISITAPSSTTNGVYFFAFGDYGASDDSVNNVNFGSPPYANSSSVTDGEYGDFEYNTTITGDSASKTFKALNTKNLAEYG